ncbi:ATP-binding cassette domain-containing protein [Euzebyella saccharophila]|uniref:ATP-binding cassette domain-containing protein n=1 Tax=Euzebyella saccharophila TaxID=679664 RepID=A0ABV8JN84_9FLAO|nr:ATP-binding cassette domain-containing protein [Euzebyella saccharophila]
MSKKHWAIFTDNSSKKSSFIQSILKGVSPQGFEQLKDSKGYLFSKRVLEKLIDEEDRHDTKIINLDRTQSLKSMSSGEQKKALLSHLISLSPDYLILDNPFDNLDFESQQRLKEELEEVQYSVQLIFLLSRRKDILPFCNHFAKLDGSSLIFLDEYEKSSQAGTRTILSGKIPAPPYSFDYDEEVLIQLNNVSVKYLDQPVLKNINWTIRKGDFWELKGKNGSGKTTILSMITGENPKGYGQDLHIFGHKKGSGESVWELKKKIGYFTPSITDKFTGYHSVENMLISGLTDSIGLYVRPTEIQSRLAKEWLQLIHMWDLRNHLFHDLSLGQKRLVMCARAMIKHPPLLILDEPTASLDDASAALFVSLVNKFAEASETTIIFVSHRIEPGLTPDYTYQLNLSPTGSTGTIL